MRQSELFHRQQSRFTDLKDLIDLTDYYHHIIDSIILMYYLNPVSFWLIRRTTMTKRNLIKMFESVLLGIFLLIAPHLISGCGTPTINNSPELNACPRNGSSGPVEITADWPTPGVILTDNVVRDNVVCRYKIYNADAKPRSLMQAFFLNTGVTASVLTYEAYLHSTDSKIRIGFSSTETKFSSNFDKTTPTIPGKTDAFLELIYVGGTAQRDDRWSCRITQFDIVLSLAATCGGNGSDRVYPNISSLETGTLIKN